MAPKITVVGSANIDYIMQMPQLPQLGETVSDGEFFQTYGGKGANQAVAAARAGAEVSFISAMGNDVTAENYKAALSLENINCSHITLEAGVATGSALIMFDRHGDNYISVAPGANARITPERVQAAEAVIIASDWIILQQEIPLATNQAVLQLAAKHNCRVLFNYAPANDLSLCPDAAVYGLIVNETEAAALLAQSFDPASTSQVARCAEELRIRGEHPFVAVTLGANGVLLAEPASTTHVPSFQVKPIDTTAAGDTFCGALALALGEGKSLSAAARFASAAAALAVTKIGAQNSIPARAEIDAFLATQAEA